MKEYYNLESLIIGKRYIYQEFGQSFGPIWMTLDNNLYIFEISDDASYAEEVVTEKKINLYDKKKYQITEKGPKDKTMLFNQEYVYGCSLKRYLEHVKIDFSYQELKEIKKGVINYQSIIKIYNYISSLKKEQNKVKRLHK